MKQVCNKLLQTNVAVVVWCHNLFDHVAGLGKGELLSVSSSVVVDLKISLLWSCFHILEVYVDLPCAGKTCPVTSSSAFDGPLKHFVCAVCPWWWAVWLHRCQRSAKGRVFRRSGLFVSCLKYKRSLVPKGSNQQLPRSFSMSTRNQDHTKVVGTILPYLECLASAFSSLSLLSMYYFPLTIYSSILAHDLYLFHAGAWGEEVLSPNCICSGLRSLQRLCSSGLEAGKKPTHVICHDDSPIIHGICNMLYINLCRVEYKISQLLIQWNRNLVKLFYCCGQKNWSTQCLTWLIVKPGSKVKGINSMQISIVVHGICSK